MEMPKIPQISDENCHHRRRNSLYFLDDWRNFNENFRKNVTYDNNKSRNKTGSHSLSLENTFSEKPAFLGLINLFF